MTEIKFDSSLTCPLCGQVTEIDPDKIMNRDCYHLKIAHGWNAEQKRGLMSEACSFVWFEMTSPDKSMIHSAGPIDWPSLTGGIR